MTTAPRSLAPIALIAAGVLVVGVAGGAVGAKLVTSADIKDGTVRKVDIAPTTVKQLKGQRGVRGPRGARGPQGAAGTTANGSVTTPKLADGAVTSAKLGVQDSIRFANGASLDSTPFGYLSTKQKLQVTEIQFRRPDSDSAFLRSYVEANADGGFRFRSIIGGLFQAPVSVAAAGFAGASGCADGPWSNLAGNGALRYSRDALGRVELGGVVTGGTLSNTTDCPITVLPKRLRPTNKLILTVWSEGHDGRVTVWPTGEVTAGAPSTAGAVSLDGLTFATPNDY